MKLFRRSSDESPARSGETQPSPSPGRSAPGALSADAVVVGGGIVGTAITYYLAKAGLKVALLEMQSIASGTSSASADALVLQTKAPGPKLTLAAESIALYRGLSEELEWDLEFRNEGGMIAALNEAELEYVQGLVERLQAGGVPVRLLDAKVAREIQPALTPKVLAATWCDLDCHLNPLRVSAAFARAAERLGARRYMGAEVTGIEVEGGRVAAVVARDLRIATPTVVNAAGVWSPAVARMAGVELQVMPRRGQLLVSEPLPPVVRGRLFGAKYLMSKLAKPVGPGGAGKPGGYLSGMALGQQAHGNFIIGGTREFVGFDRGLTAEGVYDLARQVVELLPGLAGFQTLRMYSGLRPATPDGMPIIRRFPEPEGFIAATGHEGDGICLAPVTGRIVADIVAGRMDDYHHEGGSH